MAAVSSTVARRVATSSGQSSFSRPNVSSSTPITPDRPPSHSAWPTTSTKLADAQRSTAFHVFSRFRFACTQ